MECHRPSVTTSLACPDQESVTSYLLVRRMADPCTYLEYHRRPDFSILRPPKSLNGLNTQINHLGHQKGGFALL